MMNITSQSYMNILKQPINRFRREGDKIMSDTISKQEKEAIDEEKAAYIPSVFIDPKYHNRYSSVDTAEWPQKWNTADIQSPSEWGPQIIRIETASATTTTIDLTQEKESVKVLRECIDLQIKKGNTYQNPNSSVKQADYYLRGVGTIFEDIHKKYLRIKSILETMEQDPNYQPDFEGLEDSFKDMCNYSSFATSWLRGKIDGQQTKDPLNRKKK